MKVETAESLAAKIIARAIFNKKVLDKADIERIVEKELMKFRKL